MIKSESVKIYIIFVLINITTLLLYKYSTEDQTLKYIIWINANSIYILSIGNLFYSKLPSGVLEQLFAQKTNLSYFLIREIFIIWLKAGIPLCFLASGLIFVHSTHTIDFYNTLISLIYSSFILSFIGAFCSCATSSLSSDVTAVVSIPLSVPVLIISRFIATGIQLNFKTSIIAIIFSLIIIVTVPLILNFLLRQLIED